VLEQELRDSPGLANHLQVVESIDHVLYQLLQHSASAQHSLIRYSLPYVSQIKNCICNEAAQIRRYISVQFEDYDWHDVRCRCTGRLSDHRF